MLMGVVIEKGPENWQIIQQLNGCADISLCGEWYSAEQLSSPEVYARVVREDTGDCVIPWTGCEQSGSGRWAVTLRNVPAGGLYRIETCLDHAGSNGAIEWGFRGDMIHHIGIGDLYVIAGQSNSAGYGKDPVNDPPELGVHLLRNNGRWDLASHPLNESTGTIHEENRETANPGHSPYLSFARILRRDLGYPVGLIQASLGGSPLSAWNPAENGILYKSMLKTVKSQGDTVKGILWYQGCSDAEQSLHDTYLERFGNMVSCMRKDFDNHTLPVLTVQLNRYVISGSESHDKSWGMLREVQRQAARKIPNVFIVPATDCTLSDCIHNTSASNMILGERLAKVALTHVYGRKYVCDAPDLISARHTDDGRIALTFANVAGRMYAMDIPAGELPFTMSDEDGSLGISGYEVRKNTIILAPDRELKGKGTIHGAFERNPKFIVPIDTEGHLPMLSFYGIGIE